MRAKIDKFLMILKVELKDLEADLLAMEELYKTRNLNGQISNYVLMENTAVITEEIRGIEKLIKGLNETDTADYESIDEFITRFTELCQTNSQNADLPEAVYEMFKRKISKVQKFMNE